jgi:hypothetical protein
MKKKRRLLSFLMCAMLILPQAAFPVTYAMADDGGFAGAYESAGADAGDGGGEAADGEQGTEAPSGEGDTETSADEDGAETPPDEDGTEAPSDGDAVETPADEDGAETPSDGDAVETPDGGNGTETPSDEDNTEAPSDGEGTETPAGEDTETPAGEDTETPGGEEGAEAPSGGDVPELPPEGDKPVEVPEVEPVELPEVEVEKLQTLDVELLTEEESPWEGTGDLGDPYIIRDDTGLIKLTTDVNGGKKYTGVYFELKNDINLNNDPWIPIGSSSSNQFEGFFDGKNCTISGLYINTTGTNLGLFGYIGAAEIKNLTVEGSVNENSPQANTSTNIAGIVGYVNGAANLENLTNKADVTMVRSYAGGIAGYVNGAAVFTSCVNYGEINGFYYTGGVAGRADTASFDECFNYGDVTGRSIGQYCGGITGYVVTAGLTGCKNYGDITLGAATNTNYAGGISGYGNGAAAFTDCWNYGDVTTGYMYAGGIVGYLTSGTITSCTNFGTIMDPNGYGGGIAALITTGTIRNCVNRGLVTGDIIKGGIVSRLGAGTVTGCVNYGNVQLNALASWAGGIAGDMNGAGKIMNCRNEGNITGGIVSYLGGIIGGSSSYAGTVTGNVNTGTVGDELFAGYGGGIIGHGSSASVKVENSYNLGAVLHDGSSSNIGGVAGYLSATVANCFSYYLDEGGSVPFGVLGATGSEKNSYYLSDETVAGFKGTAKNAESFKRGEVLYYLNGASAHNTVWKQGGDYPELTDAGDPASPVYQVVIAPAMGGYEGVDVKFSSQFDDKVIEEFSGSKSVYVYGGTAVGFTIKHDTAAISVTVTGVSPAPVFVPGTEVSGSVEPVGEDIRISYTLGDVTATGLDISWYSDAADSFSIGAPDELAGLAYLVNHGKDFNGKTVTLSEDTIDISGIGPWTPIGSRENPFKGTFNGNGKTVKGLKIFGEDESTPAVGDYQGLFGYTVGSISNLNVLGEVYAEGDYVGGIAGYCAGALDRLTFGDAADLNAEENKVTAPTSSVTGNDYVGGAVGYAAAAVNRSNNYGGVNGASRVGGIAGGGAAAIGASASGNTNYAPIKASGNYAGGIVGYHSQNAAVSFNVKYGDVESEGSYAGGIAGAIRGTTAAASNTNNGDVTASGDYVGGIVGSASNADGQKGKNGAALTTMTNNGAVSGGSYVGGIVGAAYGPLGNNTLATGVKNTAAVTGTGDYIGGLGGYLKSAAATIRTVSYSYNTASVNGSETSGYVGGVMGWSDGLIEYTCVAGESGAITVTGGTNVGGLAGYLGRSLNINYSYAYANVNGGVGGELAGGVSTGAEITYTNSYCLAETDDENDANAKTAARFASGEAAWLLGGGGGTRNANWGQEKGKLPVLTTGKPVFKVSIAEGAAPEGFTVAITDGSFGVPGETDGQGKQWIYVSSGERFEITTVIPDEDPYAVSFVNPLGVEAVSSEYKDGKTTAVYSVGPITANYEGKYTIAPDVAADCNWYDPAVGTFTLTSEEQLKGLAYLVNGLGGRTATTFSEKTVKLGNDIAITGGSWTPIGTSSAPFQGTFDGQNNKVSGLTISASADNQGLFGYISGNASVKNLTLLNANIVGTGSAAGGIVGTAAGSSTLSGLTFGAPGDDDSSVSGQNQTGGIVGNVAANTVTVKDCFNYGSITGTSNVGGIAGQTATGTGAVPGAITGSLNAGAVTGTSNVGGIAGSVGNYTNIGKSDDDTGAHACVNTGEVTCAGATATGVGGIVGLTGTYAKFYKSANSGKINGDIACTAVSSVAGVGGIAGRTYAYSELHESINSGEINGNISNTGLNSTAGVGGIVGAMSSANVVATSTAYATLNGCTNTGAVNGSVISTGTGGGGVGGILGVVTYTPPPTGNKITNCLNTGVVTGNNNVGGIAGQSGPGTSYTGCANEGAVQASGKVYAGGIAANLGTGSKVQNSWNTGGIIITSVSGVLGVGGITGTNQGSTSTTASASSYVENSYNTGTIQVSGVKSAGVTGGITGLYYTSNSNNYFYRHKVLVGSSEAALAVPDAAGDEYGTRRNTPIQDGAYESGELAWRLDKGDTAKRLNEWAQDTDHHCPTLAAGAYKPVYRLLVENGDEHGMVTPEDSVEYSCIASGSAVTSYIPFGGSVTLRIAPESGYTLKVLGLKGSDGKYYAPDFSADGTAALSMPEANLTASPAFIRLPLIGGPFTVTFDPNGGAFSGGVETVQTVAAGGRADPLAADPTKDDCIFAGWYDKSAVGESGSGFINYDPFDFSTIITEDVSLIACWRPVSGAMVIFDLNMDEDEAAGGQIPAQMVKFGGKITKPGEDPARASGSTLKSYTFEGWYTKETGGTEWDFDAALQAADDVDNDSIFVLYAHWKTTVVIPNQYEFTCLEDMKALGFGVENLQDYSGYTFKLGADITLPADWVSVGGANKPFNGAFDGQGYTISLNPIVTQPLFYEIGEEGLVQRLNVVGDLAGVTRATFGCIAGTNKGLIKDCSAILTGTGYVFGAGAGAIGTAAASVCGGIVGNNNGGTVSNCEATLNIDFSGYQVGGIAGVSTLGTITGCTLTGTSSIGGTTGGILTSSGCGGIVGGAFMTDIIDCIVEKGAEFNLTQQSTQLHGGGIVGHYGASSAEGADTATISGCVNYGDLTLKGSYIGGIVGDLFADGETVNLVDCKNYGDINDVPGVGAGGIAGRAVGTSTYKFERCFNYGDITNISGGVTTDAQYGDAGGIIGRATADLMATNSPNNITLINCGNEGTITDLYKYAGGLIGNVYSEFTVSKTITIKDSYNSGNVVGVGYVGGLVGGFGSPVKILIENCSVTGDLIRSDTMNYSTGGVNTQTTNVGGILGSAYSTASYTINNSYWEGSYKGTSQAYVGGLVGNLATTAGNLAATDVYWAGGFKDTVPDTSGGLFGLVGSPIGRIIVTNAYWYGDGGASAGMLGQVTDALKVSLTNAYYRLDTPEEADGDAYGEAKDEDAFASGEIAYLLDGGADKDRGVWTQNRDDGKTPFGVPVFGAPKYYPVTLYVELEGEPVPAEGYASVNGKTENIYQGAGESLDLEVELPNYENEEYGPQYAYAYTVAVAPTAGGEEKDSHEMLADETDVTVRIALEKVGDIPKPPEKPDKPDPDDGDGPGNGPGTGGTGAGTGAGDAAIPTGASADVEGVNPAPGGDSYAQTDQSQTQQAPPPPAPAEEEEPPEPDEAEPVKEEPPAPTIEDEPERKGLSTVQKIAIGVAAVGGAAAVGGGIAVATGAIGGGAAAAGGAIGGSAAGGATTGGSVAGGATTGGSAAGGSTGGKTGGRRWRIRKPRG